jgi:hypothetical protein
MAEVILNGNFDSNVPPDEFIDWWNEFTDIPVSVGIGEGIGGSDAAAYFGFNDGISQLRQRRLSSLLTPNTNYNYSIFLRADPGQTLGSYILGIAGSYISGFFYELEIPISTIPATFTQYTINFTAPVTPPDPFDTFDVYIRSIGIEAGFYVYADNVSLRGPAVCMRGDTEIYSRDTDGVVTNKRLDEINALTDQVFATSKQDFVSVKKIVMSTPTTKLCLIPAGILQPEQTDLYLTTGHIVWYNGKPTKARKVPGSKRITVELTPVYSIILDKDDYVIANGGKVKAHGIVNYNAYLDRENI